MAKALAGKLGCLHIDTGAMYRALTWLALEQGLALDDEEGLSRLAGTADIRLQPAGGADGAQLVYCQGEDVTSAIRGMPVSLAVSTVAAIPGVRAAMVEAQRKMASGREVVMDGRDIGAVVLPDAECKIFLTASVEERAKRRLLERAGGAENTADPLALEAITAELKKRDDEDINRAASPLRQPEDSVLLDTTSMSFSEVLDESLRLVREARDRRHAV